MWIGDLTLRLRNWIAEVAADGPFGNHETLTDGLVSYWALDETSGTRYDSTDTGNDLTDNNTVTAYCAGPSGVVPQFTRANTEYFSKASTVIDTSSDFTVISWIKSPTTEPDPTYVGVWSTGASDTPGLFYEPIYAGNYRLYPNSGHGTPAIDIGDNRGKWFMVVYEYNNGTTTTRIKALGVTSNNDTWSGGYVKDNSDATTFNIGRRQYNDGYMEGNIARVGYWGRTLTAAEITSIFNEGNGKSYADLSADELTGLVSYWNLDEISGARYDSHGSNDLTDNNTVTSVISGPRGVVSTFVAANNEVLTNASNVMPADSDFTAVGWMRLRSAASGHANEMFTTGDGDFILRANGLNPQIVGRGFADSVYWNSGATVTAESWHMYAGWHDSAANQFGISVDAMVPTTVASGGANGAGSTIAIGARDATPTDTTEVDGDIGSVGCWTRVLSAGEITALFNNGVAKRYADLTAAEKVGLVSYWDLTETSGTRADSHGSNDLTDNNTVTYAINLPAAPHNVDAYFTETNSEYLSRADASLVNWPQADFHMTGWAYWIDSGESGPQLWCKRNGAGTREWRVGVLTTGTRYYLNASSDGSTEDVTPNTGAGSIAANTWNFVELRRSGTTIGVAVNGGAFNDGTLSAVFNGDAPFLIGGINAGGVDGFNWNGAVAEVGLWSRVLTAQERADLFNAGRGLFYND